MKFFSSDWHLNHKNVISYCNRPYKDVIEMNDAIIKTCNETVKENDTLYLLGDVSLNPASIELYIPQLICKDIRLIYGNHDSVFPGKNGSKVQRTVRMRERYFAAGFKTIEQTKIVGIGDLIYDNPKFYPVQLSHFPFVPKDVTSEDTRYLALRPKDTGQILLHGHSHCWYRKRDKMIDVGFDGDLKIFSESDIIALIEDPRDFIETPISEHYRNRKQEKKEDV